MRTQGYDTRGNCSFAIPLSHEFADKNECVAIMNACFSKLITRITAENGHCAEYLPQIKHIQTKLPIIYDDREYTYHYKGVCFYLNRDTRFSGWKHSLVFAKYDELNYELGERVYYITIRTEEIPSSCNYQVEHNFEQKMTHECGDDCTMYSISLGSPVYANPNEPAMPTTPPRTRKPNALPPTPQTPRKPSIPPREFLDSPPRPRRPRKTLTTSFGCKLIFN